MLTFFFSFPRISVPITTLATTTILKKEVQGRRGDPDRTEADITRNDTAFHAVPTARNPSSELFCIEGTNVHLAQQHLAVPNNTVSTALKPYSNLGRNLLLSLLNTPVRQNCTCKATKSSTRAATPWLRLYPGP